MERQWSDYASCYRWFGIEFKECRNLLSFFTKVNVYACKHIWSRWNVVKRNKKYPHAHTHTQRDIISIYLFKHEIYACTTTTVNTHIIHMLCSNIIQHHCKKKEEEKQIQQRQISFYLSMTEKLASCVFVLVNFFSSSLWLLFCHECLSFI